MSSKIIIASEIQALPGRQSSLAAAWAQVASRMPAERSELYACTEGNSVLQLIALDELDSVSSFHATWREEWQALAPDAASDFNRQVFEFVEAPKDCAEPLPRTPWLQLRHVEVPPAVHADYRAWRDRTIFDVVRHAPEVETFLAYHSVISSEPGVMFFSGFSCELEAYQSVFQSERYVDIVRQAGSRFITGGDRGLYTRFYRRMDL